VGENFAAASSGGGEESEEEWQWWCHFFDMCALRRWFWGMWFLRKLEKAIEKSDVCLILFGCFMLRCLSLSRGHKRLDLCNIRIEVILIFH
jgi:hypothetical protein